MRSPKGAHFFVGTTKKFGAAYRRDSRRLSMRLLGGIYAIAAAKLSKRYLESTIILKEKPFFLCFFVYFALSLWQLCGRKVWFLYCL
jgi:hypothetical protein